MKLRKLRIAWSVAWGVVAVLLIVMWVRSYWQWDYMQVGWGTPTHQDVYYNSKYGIVRLSYIDIGSSPDITLTGWSLTTQPSSGASLTADLRLVLLGLAYQPGDHTYAVPHWFFVVIAMLLSTLVWLRLRFALRTQLIATALVAVALGLIVRGCR